MLSILKRTNFESILVLQDSIYGNHCTPLGFASAHMNVCQGQLQGCESRQLTFNVQKQPHFCFVNTINQQRQELEYRLSIKACICTMNRTLRESTPEKPPTVF